MIRKRLKAMAARIARTQVVKSLVVNIVYPTIADCVLDEIQPDSVSPSGIAEALAWKSHAYAVLNQELRATGVDCSSDEMRCDRETRRRLLDTVIARTASLEGDILEFGVYNGESLVDFAERCPQRQVYGFDSFEGLPEDWWTRPKGTFQTALPNIDKPNVILVQGLFDKSLPGFLNHWKGKAAIVHVDCDLYSSTLSCLRPILPRCRKGTAILFDEYYNYSEFAQHEWLAWRVICAQYNLAASCIAYDGRRAAFELTDLGEFGGAA
jgi:hypothetical protein